MQDASTKPTPHRTNDKHVEEARAALRLIGGEILVFAPNIQSARKPMVCLGRLRDGRRVLHFRNYRATPNGAYVISKEGASFTLPEFDRIVLAVNDLIQAAPELAEGAGRDN